MFSISIEEEFSCHGVFASPFEGDVVSILHPIQVIHAVVANLCYLGVCEDVVGDGTGPYLMP
jgi:hypothetical protein